MRELPSRFPFPKTRAEHFTKLSDRARKAYAKQNIQNRSIPKTELCLSRSAAAVTPTSAPVQTHWRLRPLELAAVSVMVVLCGLSVVSRRPLATNPKTSHKSLAEEGPAQRRDEQPPPPGPQPNADEAACKRVLEQELPRLSAESFTVREHAQRTLMQLGLPAEPRLREALERSEDAEVRARLQAVLQHFAVQEEETYALRRIEAAEPFPKSESCSIDLNNSTVAEALLKISQISGVDIEYFHKDHELQKRAKATSYKGSFHSAASPDAARWAMVVVLNELEATFVVEGKKIIIVNLTPAVLFAQLERQIPSATNPYPQDDLTQFEQPRLSHWLTLGPFLQEQAKRGGPARNRWFQVLAQRACDESESEKKRVFALRGLNKFLGAVETVQQDVDDVFIRLSTAPAISPAVRSAAMDGLAMGLSERAQQTLLNLMNQGSLSEQRMALESLYGTAYFYHSVFGTMARSPKGKKRLEAQLNALAFESEELAIPALALLAENGDLSAFDSLYKRPEPNDPGTLMIYLTALSQRTRGGENLKLDPRREKFDRFATHESDQIRALYIRLVGNSAGGKERARDVQAALALLSDRAPIVRNFAVRALGTIFSSNAAVPFGDGLLVVRAQLEELFKSEPDPRVKATIEQSLGNMQKP